jgi:hypothetical protein
VFQLEIARRIMAVREEFGYAKRKLKEEVAERGRVREEVAQRRGHLEKTWRKWVAPRGSSCIFFSQPWFHAGIGIWVKPWACGSDRFSKLAAACTV